MRAPPTTTTVVNIGAEVPPESTNEFLYTVPSTASMDEVDAVHCHCVASVDRMLQQVR